MVGVKGMIVAEAAVAEVTAAVEGEVAGRCGAIVGGHLFG